MNGKRVKQSRYRTLGAPSSYIRGGVSSERVLGNRAARILAGCDSASLHDCILALFKVGHGIYLAPTSDRGAIAITVTEGRERRRAYCTNVEELGDAIAELITDYDTGWEHE